MILRSLELENFKAFGKRARIPFAPITLIFGENSSGKSSILQALNLLKQTRESREPGILLLPRTEQGIVDLGSFQELIFDHDPSRTLGIRIETSSEGQLLWDADDGPEHANSRTTSALELRFGRASADAEGAAEIALERIEVFQATEDHTRCIAQFRPMQNPPIPRRLRHLAGWPILNTRRGGRIPLAKLTAAKCTEVTRDADAWRELFDLYHQKRQQILDRLQRHRTRTMTLPDEDDEAIWSAPQKLFQV